MLAAIRPDEQSFALLLHLVGATVVFGALLACATSMLLARGDALLLRLAGEWLYRLQHWNELPDADRPAWLDIGFIVADWGGLLFLVALALGGVGVYRLREGKGGSDLLKATMVIALILAVAYVVAVWAMTGKPN
jgi:hypothetical protein